MRLSNDLRESPLSYKEFEFLQKLFNLVKFDYFTNDDANTILKSLKDKLSFSSMTRKLINFNLLTSISLKDASEEILVNIKTKNSIYTKHVYKFTSKLRKLIEDFSDRKQLFCLYKYSEKSTLVLKHLFDLEKANIDDFKCIYKKLNPNSNINDNAWRTNYYNILKSFVSNKLVKEHIDIDTGQKTYNITYLGKQILLFKSELIEFLFYNSSCEEKHTTITIDWSKIKFRTILVHPLWC